jgi:hypothetical protein
VRLHVGRTVGDGRPKPPHGPQPRATAGCRLARLDAMCDQRHAGILGLVYGAWSYPALDGLLTDIGPIAVLALSFPIVGALIATHRPGNPLGWIFCAVGLFGGGLVTFGTMYGKYALWTAPGTVPGGPLAIWLGQWTWAPGGALLLTFVLLLFPDGHLPSRRWRPVAWLSALVTLLYPGLLAALLWPLRGPALVDQAAEAPLGGWPATVLDLMLLLIALLGLACLAGLAVRFRRARGVERQQLKWFLFASAITLVSVVAGQQQPVLRLLTVPLVAAIPVATGIAILRYQLYDIDRLISRTLVYALLTALLGAVYAGSSWSWCGCRAASPPSRRTGRSLPPPWPPPPCSSRPAAASSRQLTAASTAASTTPPRRSRRSPPACATRSTSTP